MSEESPKVYPAMFIFLRGLSKIVEEAVSEKIEKMGITNAEFYFLCTVQHESEVTVSRISEVGLWDISTAMQILNRLKKKELVNVKKKDIDKRITFVVLTEKSNELLTNMATETNLFNYFDSKYNSSEKVKLEHFQEILEEINKIYYGENFVSWAKSYEQSLNK